MKKTLNFRVLGISLLLVFIALQFHTNKEMATQNSLLKTEVDLLKTRLDVLQHNAKQANAEIAELRAGMLPAPRNLLVRN